MPALPFFLKKSPFNGDFTPWFWWGWDKRHPACFTGHWDCGNCAACVPLRAGACLSGKPLYSQANPPENRGWCGTKITHGAGAGGKRRDVPRSYLVTWRGRKGQQRKYDWLPFGALGSWWYGNYSPAPRREGGLRWGWLRLWSLAGESPPSPQPPPIARRGSFGLPRIGAPARVRPGRRPRRRQRGPAPGANSRVKARHFPMVEVEEVAYSKSG